MHRTDTLDFIIRGTNHAWSNRSNEPSLLVGTMIDATA
jgi:hypothetical protein